MAKPYPRGYAKQVGPDDYLSQEEAASLLKVSVGKIGLLIANGHLEPAETTERTWVRHVFLSPASHARALRAKRIGVNP